jgi:hypothetical protein
MLRTLAVLLSLGALSTPAMATPARIAALSANPGFFDDVDFLFYPSELDGMGENIWLSYGGTMDSGFSWEGERTKSLWVTRDDPFNQGPWRVSFTSAGQPSGYQLRSTWQPGVFTAGGSWGKGYATDGGALVVGGDLYLLGDLTESPDFGLEAFVASRKIEPKKLTAWGIEAGYLNDTISLDGLLTLGPRWEITDQITASAGFGPELGIQVFDGDVAATASLPHAQLGVEYAVRPWIALRGSASARWQALYIGEDLSWATTAGGMLGVGLRHTWADFDFAVNPLFAMNGPFFLTGSPTAPFATVASARFYL